MIKNPCVDCKHEYFRCRHICPLGIRYQMAKAEERERAKTERDKELSFSEYKFDRIQDTMKKAGMKVGGA